MFVSCYSTDDEITKLIADRVYKALITDVAQYTDGLTFAQLSELYRVLAEIEEQLNNGR